MGRLLGWANLMIGGLLLFALSGIVNWQWLASPISRLIVFILGILIPSNAVTLTVENEGSWARSYGNS